MRKSYIIFRNYWISVKCLKNFLKLMVIIFTILIPLGFLWPWNMWPQSSFWTTFSYTRCRRSALVFEIFAKKLMLLLRCHRRVAIRRIHWVVAAVFGKYLKNQGPAAVTSIGKSCSEKWPWLHIFQGPQNWRGISHVNNSNLDILFPVTIQ